jgi:hypothetical protein
MQLRLRLHATFVFKCIQMLNDLNSWNEEWKAGTIFKHLFMLNISMEAVIARAASREGSGSTKMMRLLRLRLCNTAKNHNSSSLAWNLHEIITEFSFPKMEIPSILRICTKSWLLLLDKKGNPELGFVQNKKGNPGPADSCKLYNQL